MHSHPTSGCTRSLELLELLAFAELTAPQAATALGIHPRTARRQLRLLAGAGWATARPGTVRTYGPGMRPLAASWHVLANHPTVALAVPVLRALARDGHLAELAVPSYDVVLALSPTPAGGWHSRALPPHASAAGKLLLATSVAWRHARLAGTLERFTAATLTDPGALEAELEAVAGRGYALERGEHRDDWHALAVPLDPRQHAAISLGSHDPAALERARVDAVALAYRQRSHRSGSAVGDIAPS